MKVSQMNKHQKVAYRYVCSVLSYWIRGMENLRDDSPKGSEEYEMAQNFLNMGHERMVDFLYDRVMEKTERTELKHFRFAGKAFIKERISRRLTNWGY